MDTARRILVPFDSAGPSKRACDFALELGGALEAGLSLLYVIERFDVPLSVAEQARIVSGAKHELDRAARLVRARGLEVETIVVEGEAWQQIEAIALDRRAELIVMGTHGRHGIARALLGSVASRVVRIATVPVVTVPGYVAASRRAAGTRLAAALAPLHLDAPAVIALSRGALTVATAIADRVGGTVDLWAVEPIVAEGDGVPLGAIGEDEAIVLDESRAISEAARDEAVQEARARLRAELLALKGTGSIGGCWRRDVVIVADGLFSAAAARVALEAIGKLGPSKILVASPVASSHVCVELEREAHAVVTLERATVNDMCTYRDDVLPSDVVAHELLLAPRSPGAAT